MSEAFTAKNYSINRAPKRIELLGDKSRPESAQHIIEFPGGAIEVSRTRDNEYWVHILVNQQPGLPEGSMRQTARGEIVGSRIMRDDQTGVHDIENDEKIMQIAVLVKPVFQEVEKSQPVKVKKAKAA